MLQLKVLGQFELSGPGGRIALASNKLSALLACLIWRPVPRDHRATESHFEEQARHNMRLTLVRLCKALGSDVLISHGPTRERATEL